MKKETSDVLSSKIILISLSSIFRWELKNVLFREIYYNITSTSGNYLSEYF